MTAEKALRRLHEVLELLPAYAVLLSPDYHVPFANRFFRERFGESNGRRCYEYLFDRTEPCERCETYTVFRTNAPHRWEWTGPDGRTYDIHDFPFQDIDGSSLILEVGLDVTERKRAEAELERHRDHLADLVAERTAQLEAAHAAALSEKARLQAVMEALPVGVALIDAQGGDIGANAAFEKIWGSPRPPARSVDDYVAYKATWTGTGRPVQPEEWASARAVRNGETVIGQEMEIQRVDGTRAYVLNSAAPIRDVQGEIAGSAVAMMDVSELTRAEERVRHDNLVRAGINRILGEALGDRTDEELGQVCLAVAEQVTQSKFGFIGELNSEGWLDNVAIGNTGWAACRMAEAAGRRKIPGDFALRGIYGRVLQDGKGFYTNDPASHPDRIGTPEGHPPLTAFLGVPLAQGGSAIGMIAVANREGGYRPQDLEALEALAAAVVQVFMRKRAEQALRRSREDLNRAQAVAQTGSWRLDVRRNELLWSDEVYRLFGIPQGTPLTYETFLGAVHPDDRDFVDRSWQAAVHQGEPYDIEHRILVDGAVRWIRERAELEFDSQGVLLGGFGTAQDTTVRKLIEEARAEQARLKDEFLALLSHELRNPLATISTAVHLLAKGVDPERRDALDQMMVRQVAVLQRLVDDLLDLARIAHGQVELKRHSVNLSQLIQDAAATVRSSVAGRGQELVLRLPAEHVLLLADGVRLEQVVTNLLNNASKYTGRGGRIELSGARVASEVVIRCRDNGRGIPAGMHQTIFEPFTRVRMAGEGAEAGVGIGLALVKRLVELHGGTVSAQSAGPGTGSQFEVRLPLVEPPSGPSARGRTESAPRSGRALSVVVVEDNADAAQTLLIALEQAGHRVTLFGDGPSALAGMAGLKPAAVLLDIGLPGMSGYELAARLRKKRGLRKTLFIALSGFKRRADTGTGPDDFDHYFVKPANLAELLALLQTQAGVRPRRTPRPPEPPRVLLVEDNAELAAVTAELVRSEGLEVRIAFSGHEALEAAAEFRPHLTLCDWHLPDMPGQTVIRELRSKPATRHTYGVILTALLESDTRGLTRRARELSVDQFVSKPLTSETIRALLPKLKRRR